ncbi:uncharacterized protein ColSpa_07175 [Colletotrichum spaethianum]|uniref:Uncharacterized protein n=1 Tax=Colletotrichum spaethianum TaxID=700344 RepID=A0AA37LIQ6_9PEZI|nr:uncharacterized protein ColSpa_07175 [Colletotrichum spaethianum]GKT46994.1 hypothetical protein ColSpa_07175 [Colletotrichum spaethianum]
MASPSQPGDLARRPVTSVPSSLVKPTYWLSNPEISEIVTMRIWSGYGKYEIVALRISYVCLGRTGRSSTAEYTPDSSVGPQATNGRACNYREA